MTDDDPECTDCGGTGTTYQTERRCACQGPNPLIRIADSLTEDILNLSEHEVLMDLCSANCVVPVRPQLIDALLKRFPEIMENGDALIHSQDIGKALLAEIRLAVRTLGHLRENT